MEDLAVGAANRLPVINTSEKYASSDDIGEAGATSSEGVTDRLQNIFGLLVRIVPPNRNIPVAVGRRPCDLDDIPDPACP
jgi:hypothetical protein